MDQLRVRERERVNVVWLCRPRPLTGRQVESTELSELRLSSKA